ncbi:MAG: hypothetical protein OXF46_07080 [Rhodobacteraceae bacterium]|nr:hypothetical protein [Paracoccaceae bacterium]
MLLLKSALQETLEGWQEDINPQWRIITDSVKLGFEDVSADLMIEPWEPIFPSRKGRSFPGEPEGAHIFRAFDGICPEDVRCVLLGQDPYPCPAFSTGRAFEAGNTKNWCELDKMFSKSVRAFLLQIAATRFNRSELASDFKKWPQLLNEIETGKVDFGTPSSIADRWVKSGVLLLNSSLTLSRFRVNVDPHQSHGHFLLWRPLMIAVLQYLASTNHSITIITLGNSAESITKQANLREKNGIQVIKRPHPAFFNEFLACENPFMICNIHMQKSGVSPIDW